MDPPNSEQWKKPVAASSKSSENVSLRRDKSNAQPFCEIEWKKVKNKDTHTK